MKRAHLICLFLVALSACMPPPSYINTAPKASMLSKKGDFQASAAFGSQMNIRSKRFEFDASYAPVKNLGVIARVATNGLNDEVNEFLSYNIGLVYFNQKKPSFEVLASYGQGRINSGDPKLGETDLDYFVPTIPKEEAYGFAEFKRLIVQPSFAWTFESDPNFKLYCGIRMQHLDFDRYYYILEDELAYENTFDLLLIDPFIQSSFHKGLFSLQTTLGYSMPIGTREVDGFRHPNYGRMILSFGIGFHLKSN